MDVKEYLQNPCGTLSIPYWKAKTLAIPDSMRIIHCSNWNGQYGNFQSFFRIKHDLNDLSPIDYDYDTLSIDYQATQLCEMINESYKHVTIQYAKLSPGHSLSPHKHEYEQVAMILQGKCDLYVNGVAYPMTSGSIMSIPPMAEHYVQVKGEQDVINLDIFYPKRSDRQESTEMISAKL